MASPLTTNRPALEFDADFLQRIEVLNVIAKKIVAGLLRADRKTAKKGVSAEFADHRPYVAGDDPRYVDWHLFGRLEEVFLKLYREEENLHLTLLVDTSESMNRGHQHKLNWALQVTAALAYIGMSNMDAVNILPFGGRIGDARWGIKGKAKVFKMLEYLKTLEPSGETAMAPVLREFVARERRRGVVIVISDFYDLDGYQQALKYLRYQRHDVYVLHVMDQEEEEPDLRGDLRLVDSEQERFKEINITDGLLSRYKVAFEKLATDVERFSIRNEMGYVRARTGIAFDELVLGILRRGGVVG
ncbi:MAG: DUF58 domain-containing protein [Planctomycetota bacterium]|nr:DUF58 domain-containing protein [Planctomycetota bacterium]